MKKSNFIILGLAVFFCFFSAQQTKAYQTEARITFTFDDSVKTTYSVVMPILSTYKIPAVVYGETGPLNSGEDWVMTWQQVKNLQDQYGWEIGSHTINHPYLTQVSDEQLEVELATSKLDFLDHGINAKTFATPYGDYNNKVLAAIAKYYESHRAAWGGPNHWPDTYNDYEIICEEVSNTTTVAEVKKWINQAISSKQWLVLLFHEIVKGTPQPYQYKLSNFKSIISFVATKQIKPMTISQGLKINDQPNLVNNYSLTNLDSQGWALNWQRSDEINVTVDTNNHGNAPEAVNSLKIIGGVNKNEAKTDLININGSTEYLVKVFVNIQDMISGGATIWVDQYDGSNNLLNGQWLGTNYIDFVGYRTYQFNPFSPAVTKIQLKFYSEPNSQLTFYLDSLEVRALGPATIPQPNLVKNYSFEELTNNWANNWTRSDQTSITIDNSGQGFPPLIQNSLKIVAGSDQRTGMSANISVDYTKNYQLSYYQKIANYLTGGVAVWIDEYNGTGGWVSGKWLGGTYQVYQGIRAYGYKPTASRVKQIQIHLFTEELSQLTLYLDGVEFKVVQ